MEHPIKRLLLLLRSGQPIRARFRLDLKGMLIVDMFHVSQEKTYSGTPLYGHPLNTDTRFII